MNGFGSSKNGTSAVVGGTHLQNLAGAGGLEPPPAQRPILTNGVTVSNANGADGRLGDLRCLDPGALTVTGTNPGPHQSAPPTTSPSSEANGPSPARAGATYTLATNQRCRNQPEAPPVSASP